jgi:hypothetical protein
VVTALGHVLLELEYFTNDKFEALPLFMCHNITAVDDIVLYGLEV